MSAFMTRAIRAYRTIFSIHEIEDTPTLQWVCGALLFFFFITFASWVGDSNLTIESAAAGKSVCWPYIPDCGTLYFLHDPSTDYSQTTFYMALYALMLTGVWSMWKKSWHVVHAIIFALFAWKTLVVFALSYTHADPYHYYHLILTALLLFVPHKEFFLKTGFVLLYFMSVTTKLNSTWILGTYFTSLKPGLPLLPDALTALFTNFVIFMQMIGSWFLLSRHRLLQRTVFVFFLAFHLYSGVFVMYTYPSVSLPSLIILFGPLYRHTPIPFGARTIAGWSIIGLVILFQAIGFILPGDRRLTLEHNRFGMFMFDANHQCQVDVDTYYRENPPNLSAGGTGTCGDFFCITEHSLHDMDGATMRHVRYESPISWNRCDPYVWWAKLHSRCSVDPAIDRIALTINHSINGGPFVRTVETGNICAETYRLFERNMWIHSPPDTEIIGFPVENSYR